jgi:hypothetical protein
MKMKERCRSGGNRFEASSSASGTSFIRGSKYEGNCRILCDCRGNELPSIGAILCCKAALFQHKFQLAGRLITELDGIHRKFEGICPLSGQVATALAGKSQPLPHSTPTILKMSALRGAKLK